MTDKIFLVKLSILRRPEWSARRTISC